MLKVCREQVSYSALLAARQSWKAWWVTTSTLINELSQGLMSFTWCTGVLYYVYSGHRWVAQVKKNRRLCGYAVKMSIAKTWCQRLHSRYCHLLNNSALYLRADASAAEWGGKQKGKRKKTFIFVPTGGAAAACLDSRSGDKATGQTIAWDLIG